MTYLDLVHEYFPGEGDDFADMVLWNETAYPFCGIDRLRLQLGIAAERRALCVDVRRVIEEEMLAALAATRGGEDR